MKKLMVALALILFVGRVGNAQCNKTIKWSTEKQELLDASGTVVDVRHDHAVVEISEKTIRIHAEGKNDQMSGTIEETTCEWTRPYKIGKTTYKVILSDPDGDRIETLVVVEGKDDQVCIYLHPSASDPTQRKVRIIVSKYEEVD